MKALKKLLIGVILISLIIIPISTQFVKGQNDQIKVKEEADGITISTKYLTMKIVDGKPHFIWWNGNQSTAEEIYNVKYVTLEEFFGNDSVLDNLSELGGISYNLLTSNWVATIIEEETSVRIILTLSGLANGAEIQIIVYIYNQDQTISDAGQVIKGLTEVKFDIRIKNWLFSGDAKGLALKTQILESQKRNTVRVRVGSGFGGSNITDVIEFESEKHRNSVVAFYKWTNFAEIFDNESKISEIEVGTSYLSGGIPGIGPRPSLSVPGMVQQWLTYPNYGDSLTMIHDPSIGVNPESITVPLYLWPIIGGILTTALIVVMKKKGIK